MLASPTKLRDGSWGARVQGVVRSGDEITIETKAGKRWTATVRRVLWTGEGVSIVATESSGGRRSEGRSRSRHPRTGCSCGSREGMVQDTDCWTCRFDELDC